MSETTQWRLNLPPYEHKLRTVGGHVSIYDPLRRRYVALTPEEWVRQHFVNYLTQHLGYPPTLLANEVELRVGRKRLRCDSVVYDSRLQPLMIVEYKQPGVAISQRTFDQITAYNQQLHVDYLLVSNGISHYCCRMDYERQSYDFLESLPRYEEILHRHTIWE